MQSGLGAEHGVEVGMVHPAALVAMMSELREGLRRADSQLIMGAFVSVNVTDQIATGNDYNKLVGSFDFFAIMAYDSL